MPEGEPMLKAVVRDGEIRPLEPLPEDWPEGQPLRVEKAEDGEIALDDIDHDFAVLAKLCESSLPEEENQLEERLLEARRQAKEMVLRQMGLR
jgi:hypothetical protein